MTTPAIRPDSARHNGQRCETSPIGEIKHELAETGSRQFFSSLLVLRTGTGNGSFMAVIDEVKRVLGETLQLGARVDGFSAATPLFGAIAEFDSMAVVAVVTALEERFDFFVEDDEIEAEVFATIGSLAAFVSQKLDA